MTAWLSRPYPNHRMRDRVAETILTYDSEEELEEMVARWSARLNADEIDGEPLGDDPCVPHCDGLCIWAAAS